MLNLSVQQRGQHGENNQHKAEENQNADYAKIKTVLEGISVDDLACSSGLSSDEYQRLMESPFVDECVHLVLKGLKTLASASMSTKTEGHDE